MARVAHDRTAYGQRSGGLLVVQRNTRLYLLEANGDLDRADDVDGTDAGEVAAFLAGETLVDGYTTEAGGTTVSYPLVADSHGHWPVSWHESSKSYDEYCPDDPVDPLRRWEGVSAGDVGGVLLDQAESVSNLPATAVYPAAPTQWAGMSVDVPAGERPVKLEVSCPARVSISLATSRGLVSIIEGAGSPTLFAAIDSLVAGEGVPLLADQVIDGDPDNDRTFQLAGSVTVAATFTLNGSAEMPIQFRAVSM